MADQRWIGNALRRRLGMASSYYGMTRPTMADDVDPAQLTGRSQGADTTPGVPAQYDTGSGSVGRGDPGVLAGDNNEFASAVSASQEDEPNARPRYASYSAIQNRGRIVQAYPGSSRHPAAYSEVYGASYEMQRSRKSAQTPHWAGNLVPSAIPDRDRNRADEFFDGASVLGSRAFLDSLLRPDDDQ